MLKSPPIGGTTSLGWLQSCLRFPQSQTKLSPCRKKKVAATGPDGLSRSDLLRLPDSLHLALIGVCEHAERTGAWPMQLVTGIVKSLQKIPGAATVNQYRPITVFSLCYRIWSSLRGRQVLWHLCKFASSGMFGNLPKRHAKQLWWMTQHQVAEAHKLGYATSGLICDIVKAFNCLPRWPIFAAASRLGLPSGVLRGWYGAVLLMERRFQVRESVGPPIKSSTGFAEGCALSCAAMAIMDILFELVVTHEIPGSLPLSFVDNWAVQVESARDVPCALEVVEQFAATVDLQVDRDKTHGWAAQAAGRQQIRAAGCNVRLSARSWSPHAVQSPIH